jgi:hypothetical protein
MYDRRLAGEIGRDAAAGGPAAAAAAAADIFSARPDLFPPIGAIEIYRYFLTGGALTVLPFTAATAVAVPNRLRIQIPAGMQFRISKFSCLRVPSATHDDTQAGWPDAEEAITTGNVHPTELLLDGAPVAGSRLLFDDGGPGLNGQAHDVFVRGRGPVEISVRFTKQSLVVNWGAAGAWYRGWMWASPK